MYSEGDALPGYSIFKMTLDDEQDIEACKPGVEMFADRKPTWCGEIKGALQQVGGAHR